jgi:hypothetical protein
MAKKAAAKKTVERTTLHLRCKEVDLTRFRDAAEDEGFNNLTAWVLYHLRNQAKQTHSDEREK